MADLTFNTTPGQTVGREMLIAYLNTAEDIGTPKWSAIGKRVEDSSSEYDWQTETKVDIFGNTCFGCRPIFFARPEVYKIVFRLTIVLFDVDNVTIFPIKFSV